MIGNVFLTGAVTSLTTDAQFCHFRVEHPRTIIQPGIPPCAVTAYAVVIPLGHQSLLIIGASHESRLSRDPPLILNEVDQRKGLHQSLKTGAFHPISLVVMRAGGHDHLKVDGWNAGQIAPFFALDCLHHQIWIRHARPKRVIGSGDGVGESITQNGLAVEISQDRFREGSHGHGAMIGCHPGMMLIGMA